MLSEEMKKKYDEAYESFEKLVDTSSVSVRHRSLKKYENKTNQDVLFYVNGKSVLGVYVAKTTYKIWLDNADWYATSKANKTEMKEDGYYSILCSSLDDCIDELKNFFHHEYHVHF